MKRPSGRFLLHAAAVCLIGALAAALYVPFLRNPLVFDDNFFFGSSSFAYYATRPFGLHYRLPAYFSLAATSVLFGGIVAQRIVSLVLHVACSLALYKLVFDLLQAAASRSSGPATQPAATANAVVPALAVAAVFALHPLSVYGAGYLIQRSIVLATLFSLLSVVLFLRGMTRRSHADAISAALLYSVAVLSKEHSILLPAAAALVASLVVSDRRFAVRHALIYLALCAPAAVFVTLLRKGLIGTAFEPAFHEVAAQIETAFGSDITKFTWPLSVVTQAGLFFKYVGLWLWPDTRAMAVDLRVNFLDGWSPGWIVLKVGTFAAFGALGLLLLRRRGKAGVAGFGMLFTWLLFLVEFSVSRFQDPFVLYRSYLWASGIMIVLAALLSSLPPRPVLAALAVACPILFYQAHDRLVTFSSPLLLWEDAVAKLPPGPVPWGSETLYNLGREYLYSGKSEKAIEIVDRCVALYPTTVQCYYALGAIHLQQEQYALAVPYLRRAIELDPKSGIIYHRLGLAMEHLGRVDEAKALYRRASDLGYKGADYELSRLAARRQAPRQAKGTRAPR